MEPEDSNMSYSKLAGLKAEIARDYLSDENLVVQRLLNEVACSSLGITESEALANDLIAGIRIRLSHDSGLSALLRHYDLSTQEGVTLMCLAEALLRIPDNETVDALIADKLAGGQWRQHLGQSESLFVNASTWALTLSGRLLSPQQSEQQLDKLIARLDAPVFRTILKQAMQRIAEQFVMSEDIDTALQRAKKKDNQHYLYSYDMLGEAALTSADAEHYKQAYLNAIRVIGNACDTTLPVQQRPSISVKLSALYPRYEYKRRSLAVSHLCPLLLELAVAAKQLGIGLTVDAEEASRLELSLEIFERVYLSDDLVGWPGLGLAVQAYQKRALSSLNYLKQLAEIGGRRIPLRLVKGAYWDYEIKYAQQQGLADYPVFTEKKNTDISYLACANYLLAHRQAFYPQFATHNAHTVATILHSTAGNDFEFQRLHGMGEELYQQLLTGKPGVEKAADILCRVYAPVGAHQDLLPYLVRRLLENGANSSFVNQVAHLECEQDLTLSASEIRKYSEQTTYRNTMIPLPSDVFGAERKSAKGVNFANAQEQQSFLLAVKEGLADIKPCQPIIAGEQLALPAREAFNPADKQQKIAENQVLSGADSYRVEQALSVALEGWTAWRDKPVGARADILLIAADLFEQHRAELVGLCVKEAGKTVEDSLADVREAIDFLRYYAQQAVAQMTVPTVLPSFAGEQNELRLQGRGVFLCVSPWNFPVAIFTGQIAAALVTGNCVLAKPSSLATLTAQRAIDLLYQAGVPASVLHYLPCDSAALSTTLLDERLAGVAFTGSGQVATDIHRQLALRDGPIATLIAETGGQNVLMADSSAQPEQLVMDVMKSAFNSAGQRCSALRVLYIQEDIAEQVIELLCGAMDELIVGDPLAMETDIGPVISASAQAALNKHIGYWQKQERLLYQSLLPPACDNGHFVAPTLIEIDAIGQLSEEHFGPILHVVRYSANQFDEVINAINDTGFGLTFGFHSRIEQRIQQVQQNIRVGNIYINRDTVGAIVGAQPFGGCGLSGTGPKAGGPNYLLAFSTEQTRTVNTAAVGGNVQLMSGQKTVK